MQESPFGELSRLGGPSPQTDHHPQDRPLSGGTPMAMDLDHVLARVGRGRPHDDRQCFIYRAPGTWIDHVAVAHDVRVPLPEIRRPGRTECLLGDAHGVDPLRRTIPMAPVPDAVERADDGVAGRITQARMLGAGGHGPRRRARLRGRHPV